MLIACARIGPSALGDGINIETQVTNSTLLPDTVPHCIDEHVHEKWATIYCPSTLGDNKNQLQRVPR